MPLGAARAVFMGAAGRSTVPAGALYWLGEENVAWVEGYSENAGTVSKESNHLYMKAQAIGDPSNRAYEIAATVNLTGYTKVCVDWECPTLDDGDAALAVVHAPNLYWAEGLPYLNITAPFARQVSELAISSTLDRYIAVHVYANGFSNEITELKVYKVWLE